MKHTLLDMTQEILSSLGSDEVNSIDDSTESRQVARIIRAKYFDIISRADIPEYEKLFNLEASGDITKPVLMTAPDNVTRIDWVEYNVDDTGDEPDYRCIDIISLRPFKAFTQDALTDVSGSFTLGATEFFYEPNEFPKKCTIIDDLYVVFDSYDNTVDATLQSSKTRCFGQVVPEFSLENAFVPNLDDNQFPLLINEAKASAFLELKEMNHELAVLEARRQWRNLPRTKRLNKPSDFDSLPHFGRK